MIHLKTLIAIVVTTTAAMTTEAQALYTPDSWTPEMVSAAVASCRAAITDNATRDYLTRHNLSSKDLPSDFNQRIAPVIEPFLLTCDCLIGTLAKEFPLSEFQANTPKVQERIKELMSKGGACAAPAGP